VIVEPVDDAGEPIGPGQTSARVFVTPLFNGLFPLVRFELTDRISWLDEPCPCGATLRRIADIEERYDADFDYDGRSVSPKDLRVAMTKQGREVSDFQMFQTPRGVRVILRTRGSSGASSSMVGDLRAVLRAHGLVDPEVEVDTSGEFKRLPSGKLKRYMPLGMPHHDLVSDPPAFAQAARHDESPVAAAR
jgi:phenylacetate-CoA ligase